MQDIRHESLEPHILYSGNVLGSLEILGRAIGAAFSCVVDEVLWGEGGG